MICVLCCRHLPAQGARIARELEVLQQSDGKIHGTENDFGEVLEDSRLMIVVDRGDSCGDFSTSY